jgi:integrase
MGKRRNGEGSIYQDSRRLWRASVSLDGGTRKYLSGRTRAEVAKKLNAALDRRDMGMPFVRGTMTVTAWLDYWMQSSIKPRYASSGEQIGGREPTTWASYENLVQKHIKPHLGNIPLAKLQVEHVERWQRDLERAGASAETRRAALVRLRTALNVATQRSHVHRNVAELVPTRKQSRKKYEMPQLADVHRILDAVRGDDLVALVYLALGLGLSRAEVLGLRRARERVSG